METIELTTEGASILFTKYDLDVLRQVLLEVALRIDREDFELRTGCSFREVERMAEKVTKTHQMVMES